MKKFLLPLASFLFLFVGCEPDEIEYGYSARENILSVQNSSGTVAVPFVRKITFTDVTDNGSGAITVTTGATTGSGVDATAIHDNEAGEIAAITEKVTPANDDVFIIEDSVAGNVKKKVKWSSLPGAAGGDNVSIDGVAVVDPDFVSTGDIDFVDTSNTVTANINADSITKSMLADEDWGDVSVASNVVSLDTDIINTTHLADEDWGDISINSGVATIDNDSVTPNDILSTGQVDEYCLTYEATGSTWEWQACAGGGSGDVTAALNLTDNAIVRGDGGAKGVQEGSVVIDDNANITIGDGTALDYTLTWDALANDGTFTFDESANDLIWDSNLVVSGDFTVNGTSTTLNTSTVEVEDTNMVLGNVTTPTDLTADGGGITLLGDTNKTILWENNTDSWDFNQIVKTVADFIGVNLDLSGYIDLVEITAPASPAANDGRLYVADDGGTTKLYFKDSAGTATDLLAGGTGGGATTALDNLASVAINTSLISDTDSTDDLGSSTKQWKDLYVDRILNSTTGNLTIENDVSDGDIIFKVNDDGVDTTLMTLDGSESLVGIRHGSNIGSTKLQVGTYTSTPSTTSTATISGSLATSTMGQEVQLRLIRPQSGGSYSQVADFTLGRWQTNGAAPETRLDINLKDTSSNDHIGENTVMSLISDGKVGIGTTAPGATLDVRGSAIFNEDGGDNDFRVEGDTVTNLLHVDASVDAVGINATPLSTAKLAVGGAIAYTPLSAKPENCAAGSVGFLYFYTTGSGSSLCGCFRTSASTYAWVTLYSAGSVSCPA